MKKTIKVLAPALVAIAPFVQQASSAPSAQAQSISSLQAEASNIASQIAQLNNEVAVYAEKYDYAQSQLQQINGDISQVKGQIISEQARVKAIKQQLSQEAIDSYMNMGGASTVMTVLQGTETQATLSQSFLSTVSMNQQDLVTSYQQATAQLALEQAKLASEQSQAQVELNQVQSAAQQAQSATTQDQSLLASIKGQIATLVQQQLQAQQAAKEKAAQAALAQQQAQTPPQNSTPAATQPNYSASSTSGSISQAMQIAVNAALSMQGKPYVWGGASPSTGFDCSGLVMWAYAQAGISLPHNAAMQYEATQRISYSQLQPGDLIFFGMLPYHVAIYIGGGMEVVADDPQWPIHVVPISFDGTPSAFGQVTG
ncbi:Cell wall-associated hydrolase, NlpC family [Ferrithrix thermotolerans DSM 19514]|uniref:Cell wall-associated hydrolase, NlpC family n=1 Tax=Ferrithrix thermotolerans DSM 19514 TaxID=1121881 RepID=A0A1M4SAN6_9ACTN|nr:C40 family peptidase [Ferrithrix thermotolerans]SHE29294.1 Cell wall-associated hydrolase, NlpC family [Ferrithrix thermotolerans DSM 19514]